MSAPDLAAVPDEPPQTVELAGRVFRLDDRGVSLMGLMEFAELARRQGQSTSGQDEMDALAALLGLLQECIAADEWDAFRAHARQVRADADELNAVMTDAVAAKAAALHGRRPARRMGGRQPARTRRPDRPRRPRPPGSGTWRCSAPWRTTDGRTWRSS
jgi:hypothetical protein